MVKKTKLTDLGTSFPQTSQGNFSWTVRICFFRYGCSWVRNAHRLHCRIGRSDRSDFLHFLLPKCVFNWFTPENDFAQCSQIMFGFLLRWTSIMCLLVSFWESNTIGQMPQQIFQMPKCDVWTWYLYESCDSNLVGHWLHS